jgi:3'(2'), 5'-bisphosphate nucleotidase
MVIERATERQLGREAAVAMRAVAEAVDLARELERDVAAGALWKGDASPVTVADFSVQALIAARLSRDFPSDALVAEEDASALRGAPHLAARIVDFVRLAESALPVDQILALIDRGRGSPGRRFWALDPIDGTKGLLRGGQYAVALALIEEGVVKTGVLGCPRLSLRERSVVNAARDLRGDGGIAVAVHGRGAWWSSDSSGPLVRLSVSQVNEPEHARVLHSFETPHNDAEMLRHVVNALSLERAPWLMDSQAKHAVVSSGAADILLRVPTGQSYREAIWDEAAGSLLIEEAGGRVTDLVGRALDFSAGRRLSRNVGLVATNGVLHDAVLKAIQDTRAKRLPPGALTGSP